MAVTVGSVSTGTLREFDLLKAFVATLWELGQMGDLADIEAEHEGWFSSLMASLRLSEDDIPEGEIGNALEMAYDALQNVAPEGMYFGTLEGDGADFGFWPCDFR